MANGNLDGNVLLFAIMGEYFDYRLQSSLDCPDLRFSCEQSAAWRKDGKQERKTV